MSSVSAPDNWGIEKLGPAVTLAGDLVVDFTGLGGYDKVVFELYNVRSSVDADILSARVSFDGGSTYDSAVSNYRSMGVNKPYSGSLGDFGLLGDSVQFTDGSTLGNATGEDGMSGFLTMYMCPTGTARMGLEGFYINSAGSPRWWRGGGRVETAGVPDAMRFFMSSGNLASGQITGYGLKA